jgi:hypothetical protein
VARVAKRRTVPKRGFLRRIDPLVPAETYFVEVCGFTFRFDSVGQIRRYHDYFSQTKRERHRIPRKSDGMFNGDHGERQTPFTRLPAKLLSRSNRPKVVKALALALAAFAGRG